MLEEHRDVFGVGAKSLEEWFANCVAKYNTELKAPADTESEDYISNCIDGQYVGPTVSKSLRAMLNHAHGVFCPPELSFACLLVSINMSRVLSYFDILRKVHQTIFECVQDHPIHAAAEAIVKDIVLTGKNSFEHRSTVFANSQTVHGIVFKIKAIVTMPEFDKDISFRDKLNAIVARQEGVEFTRDLPALLLQFENEAIPAVKQILDIIVKYEKPVHFIANHFTKNSPAPEGLFAGYRYSKDVDFGNNHMLQAPSAEQAIAIPDGSVSTECQMKLQSSVTRLPKVSIVSAPSDGVPLKTEKMMNEDKDKDVDMHNRSETCDAMGLGKSGWQSTDEEGGAAVDDSSSDESV
jgi:hypothetical protein